MLKMDSTKLLVGFIEVHGQDFKLSPCSSAYLRNEVLIFYVVRLIFGICVWIEDAL